jgi:hypothetical protein
VRNGDYGQRPGGVAQAFDLAGKTKPVGCPSFAFLTKGFKEVGRISNGESA